MEGGAFTQFGKWTSEEHSSQLTCSALFRREDFLICIIGIPVNPLQEKSGM